MDVAMRAIFLAVGFFISATTSFAAQDWPPKKGAVPDKQTAIEVAVAVYNGWARPRQQLTVDAIYPRYVVVDLVRDPKLGEVWNIHDSGDLCGPGSRTEAPCSGGYFGMLIRKRDGAILDFLPTQ
jgi:hypothetical protein